MTDLDCERGLYGKYCVEKVNGKPVGECFVLEAHDPFAVWALRKYADLCIGEFPQLAGDLQTMADRWSNAQVVAEAYIWAPKDFVTVWDDENTFPFIEDENAVIYGYGHHDKAKFVEVVKRYDMVVGGCDPEDCGCSEAEIQHLYAAPDRTYPEERFTWKDVTPETPGAFPLTLVYR